MTHVGQKFGDWVVISEEWSDFAKSRRVRTRCVCGREFDNHAYRLESGKSLSCGCQRNIRRLRPFESVYRETKKRALRRGLSFSLTYRDYIKLADAGICFYCETVLSWPSRGRRSRNEKPPKGYMASNIDRKNNLFGYSKTNTVACCGRCNQVKGKHLSFEEMVEVGKILKRFREAQ